MAENRIKTILRASIIAIITNILLGAFKAFVGIITHSIAITMDAVNNITDAASSFITIISAKFSTKTPNKKHPFGYGRTEYLGTLLIGGLILYAGITACIESVKMIINPEIPEYSLVTLIIISVAAIVKIFLTIFITKTGKKVNSDSLIASGKESIGDVAISISTIIAALLYVFAHIAIEAWLGVAIALLIIKAGFETLRETVGKILGDNSDVALVKDIKKTIASNESVEGAYDLILHNYGPDSYIGSVHIEVADTMTINTLDELTRSIKDEVFEKHGVYISAVGIYSKNISDEKVVKIKESIKAIALSDSMINQIHGFYIDLNKKDMRFDLVVSFEAKDRKAVFDDTVERIKNAYPEYAFNIGMDSDFNEL